MEVKNIMNGLNFEKIVFKPMSKEELIISLERMQRFSTPFRKYDRVYREILLKHLITPKISLKNYHEFSYGMINYLAQVIWNQSVRLLNPEISENYNLNLYLLYEEIKEFSVKETLKKIVFSKNISGYAKPANFSESDFVCSESILKDIFEQNGIEFENTYSGINFSDEFSGIYVCIKMSYPLNISGFLQLINSENNLSGNLKRLIWLNNYFVEHQINLNTQNYEQTLKNMYKSAEKYRSNNATKKPYKLILLVEGTTEELLLPVFSRVVGVDFFKNGIEVVASGGKNQVARIYSEINQETNLPIFIIMDSDAGEIANEINKIIRLQDKMYLIKNGEFEDILPDELICRAINIHYGLIGKIIKDELPSNMRKTELLTKIWKQKGYGEFKKAEFAHIISQNIKSLNDISPEMTAIISYIKNMLL